MMEEIKKEINKIIKKSIRALSAARDHLDKSDYDFASSKAYYATFHALQAILLTRELTFSKHSAVIAAFSQHFIKTGMFPKDFGSKIERLFKERQIGDYGYEPEISEEDAKEDLEISETIINAIQESLNKEGVE